MVVALSGRRRDTSGIGRGLFADTLGFSPGGFIGVLTRVSYLTRTTTERVYWHAPPPAN